MSTPQVVVVLPGTTGSTLTGSDGKTVVWPAIVAPLAVSDPAGAAAIMEDRNPVYKALKVGCVAGWEKQKGVYYTLLTQLASDVGGSAYCADPNQAGSNWGLGGLSGAASAVIGFPYDWRKDNLFNAATHSSLGSNPGSLQAFLGYINTLYKSNVAIYLVAHSMGGILSRTYLELVGGADACFSQIKGLVTLGTPHLGAPLAFQAVNGMINMKTYVGTLEVDDIPIPLAGFDAMVWDFVDSDYGNSTFELLPPPYMAGSNMPAAVQFISDQSLAAAGGPYGFLSASGLNNDLPGAMQALLQTQVASGATWAEVTSASTSSASLLSQLGNAAYGSVSGKLPPYYCIYGVSCMYPTSTGILYVGASGTWTSSMAQWFSVDQVQGGDQIVPTWSATFQGRSVAGVYRALQAPAPTGSNPPTPPGSVSHLQLPGSPDAMAQIKQWLGLGS